MILPRRVTLSDFQMLVKDAACKHHLESDDNFTFFARRRYWVPVHEDNFALLIQNRLTALSKIHLEGRIPLQFKVEAKKVCDEQIALRRNATTDQQELEEADEALKTEYDKMKVLELFQVVDKGDEIRLRMRVSQAVLRSLLGQSDETASEPGSLFRRRQKMSIEQFKKLSDQIIK